MMLTVKKFRMPRSGLAGSNSSISVVCSVIESLYARRGGCRAALSCFLPVCCFLLSRLEGMLMLGGADL